MSWLGKDVRNINDEDAKPEIAAYAICEGGYATPDRVAGLLNLPVEQVARVLGNMFLSGELKRSSQ